ncbi:MAG: hypothetical protein HY718_01520, partial [Planctomycetes bacterium]|nr:hypothetical protein [Planctomycetota bacterium]
MSLNRQIPGKPVVPSNRRLPNHVPIGRKAGRMPAPQGNRSVPCRVLIGLTAVNLMVGSPVLAQQRTPDFVNIRKTNLAGIDRNNVEAWVAEQMQQLFAAKDDKAVQTQGLAFLNTVTTHVKDTSATEGFRTGMAGIVADGFIKSYKAAPVDRRPLAAVYLLLTLQQIVEAAQPAQAPQNLVDAFTLALADPTAGARTMGATGLSTLREKFTQPQWTALLPVIQRAAPDEPNEVALDRMYRLLMV